jgi:hypothetical protein
MPTDVFELHIQQSLQKLEDLWQLSKAIPNPDSQLWQNTKELAVFINGDLKKEYYTKISQIQRGEISEATLQLELTPRKQDPLAVECLVSAVRDRLGEIIALRWRIWLIKVNNNVEKTAIFHNFTSTLIKTLRYPIYNLATEIEEIQTSEQSTLIKTDRRLQQINNKIVHRCFFVK